MDEEGADVRPALLDGEVEGRKVLVLLPEIDWKLVFVEVSGLYHTFSGRPIRLGCSEAANLDHLPR